MTSAKVNYSDFFSSTLNNDDHEIAQIVSNEMSRQRQGIELIASENIVSTAVLEAQGSILTNKYAEGYPGRRYYGGCEFVDEAERLAIERAKTLFGCAYANVQPHSGCQANQGVFLALLNPGDTILGLDLAAGGHLTHGARVSMSGKWFKGISYGVRQVDQRVDYDEIEHLAREHKPKLIIGGGSAYARWWDFARLRDIADGVGAYFMFDMAHIAGLVAGGAHPSPIPHAHVVTSTTHKTLRGPRGGMILTNNQDIAKRINSAMFPGLQGGPLMHIIAAKAVAYREAQQPSFAEYAKAVVANAAILAQCLKERGFDLVTDGTDNHLILVDLRSKGVTGDMVEAALGRAGITCNKNSIPFDPARPSVTSGVRFGTPATTTRGFRPTDYAVIASHIAEVVDVLAVGGPQEIAQVEASVRGRNQQMVGRHPIYE